MPMSAYYRDAADRIVRIADLCYSDSERIRFIHLAQTYRQLADDLDVRDLVMSPQKTVQ